ncbi:MAG TPA: DUF167 family protein [Candidatus Paceibacterota bacterium]|nr:DUF167 family protein [Candidatus Paceibacterota bacterium]
MYIKAEVKTNAKKEKLEVKDENRFIISVKEKSERNIANERVIQVLADYFKISPSKIRIINGHHKSHKLLNIFE